MKLSNIIIIPKLSKYELDMHRYNLTHEELIDKYKEEGVNLERIMSSHERQKESLNKLKNFFSEQQFISREKLTREIAANSDLVIAFGGDNHFQYVSHFIDNGLIMGINSDPLTSEGSLVYFTIKDFKNTLKKLEKGDFQVEEWTRLEAGLNANYIGLATCDYFLGESERKYMSRHILELKGKKEEQKCSGLLIITGAGSTGWYNSAYRYLNMIENKFSKTKKSARFLATEPYKGRLSGYSMSEGTLEKGEELIVHSLNDDNGILSVDSLEDHNFNRGATTVIRISDKSLNVIKVEK